MVCRQIDTIQTYDPYGSTVVEQSPFSRVFDNCVRLLTGRVAY